MAPAPSALQYAIRKPHSRTATWAWLGAMLTLGIGTPMMVADHCLEPHAAEEVWLEILTLCATQLGRTLQHSLALIAWVLATILLSAPGFLTLSAKVQRLHRIGAALAIITFASLATSLQLAHHKPAPSISSQSEPNSLPARRAPPRPR